MIEELLNEKCVVWPISGRDRYGERTFGAAVERACHWENDAQLFRNEKGEEVVSAAVVWLQVEVERGSMFWWGKLADVPDSTDPFAETNSEVYEAMMQGRIQGTEEDDEILYRVMLQ